MSEKKRLKLIAKEIGITCKWYMPSFLIKKRILNAKIIEIGSSDYYIKMIKANCFRGKVIAGIMQITIKVPSKIIIESFIYGLDAGIGIAGIEYKVEKLWFFECWFPRYQFIRMGVGNE